jgi:hypothetical protein
MLKTPEYFFSALGNSSMHRQDGKRIGFMFGIYEAVTVEDAKYLTDEVNSGNPYVHFATADQVNTWKMRRDPKGTMTKSIRQEMEPQLRQELDTKIRAEIAAKLARGDSIESIIGEAQTAQAESAEQARQAALLAGKTGAVAPDSGAGTTHTLSDTAKLGGASPVDRVAALRAKTVQTSTGPATMSMVGSDPTAGNREPIMASRPAPLGGIVNSSDIKDASGMSGQDGGSMGGSAGPVI